MKLKPWHMILSIFTLGMMVSTQGFSQEERTANELEFSTTKSDSPPASEGELKPVKIQAPSSQRDSIQIKPIVKPTKPSEKTQKNTEDPLSFNFLYYIIEKFKLSDIIE